jgi:glycosyltransferase involved in cell wall biosynthesis
VFRSCNALFVHTEALKLELSELAGSGHPPIFVTPHGAWSDSAYMRNGIAPEDRADRKHLLLFGLLGHYKGVHVLLDALKLLPDDYTLTIAGQPVDEAYRQLIRGKVASFAPGRVELIDRFIAEEEIPGLFSKSSLLVLPYVNFNAQSGVLHDAISWNLPVVGTDVGALGDSIRSWSLGEVVEPSNEKSLADAIVRMYQPERYAAALAGIHEAQHELNWDRTAEATVAGYRSVTEFSKTNG